jgi:hypothetical protein
MQARHTLIIALLGVAGCKPNEPAQPMTAQAFTTGNQLIEAMQNRYAGRWYRSVSFVQTSTTFAPDGKQQTANFYEAALLPSRLRVDFDPISAGNGLLVLADTQIVMQRGSVARRVAESNELLLLGFDVYFLDPKFTAEWLSRLGFDVSRIRQDVWEGRPVYVVGAKSPADLTSRQFWVDRENMVVVRLLEPGRTAKTDDIRFAQYERIGRAWIAPLVEIYNDGKLAVRQQYRRIRIDQPLDVAMFDPNSWATARHWYLNDR